MMSIVNQTVKEQRPIDSVLAEVNGNLTNKVSEFVKNDYVKIINTDKKLIPKDDKKKLEEWKRADEWKTSVSKSLQEILMMTRRNIVIKKVPTLVAGNDQLHLLGVDSTKNMIVFATFLSHEGKNKGILFKLELDAQQQSIAQENIKSSLRIIISKNKVKETFKSWEMEKWRTVKSEADAFTELIR